MMTILKRNQASLFLAASLWGLLGSYGQAPFLAAKAAAQVVRGTIVHVHDPSYLSCLGQCDDQVFIARCDGCFGASGSRQYILLRFVAAHESDRIAFSDLERGQELDLKVRRDPSCDAPISAFGETRSCGNGASYVAPPFVSVGSGGLTFDQMRTYGVFQCFILEANPYAKQAHGKPRQTSNNRLKLPARGRPVADGWLRTRAAA